MTSLTAAPRRATHAPAHRLTFAHLLRSETIKILTLRSTWWSFGLTAALSLAISFLLAMAARDNGGEFAAATLMTAPIQFTMLVAGIFGAIIITGEYSTGMIRSTLTAEPRRGAVLLAKAIVISAVMAVTTAVTYVLASVITAPLVTGGLDWSTPSESVVPLTLGVASMIAFSLIGLGFGVLIRNGAGAIAATVGVLFVLPIVVSLFAFTGERWQWLLDSAQYLPMNAAATLTSPGATDLAAPAIALTAWALVPLLLGWAALRSRDA
ncbi:ABC transporter permease subunit [Microbacterium sp. VKM Ac-2923]|uniref:ABC transporter permease subunit n=1 Tax=Microbacterium sp. VKM Ac-2923 TaxID=2929476 RepID=UPI001FB53CAE|nr:ABC transporter permease subunit [Microbacterium sp. VKM Ac-2923]MCJ1707530.1 ABC transporter permease [Microbacterium sp. VKM Ac-2923]